MNEFIIAQPSNVNSQTTVKKCRQLPSSVIYVFICCLFPSRLQLLIAQRALISENSSERKRNLIRLIKFHNFNPKLSKRNSHDFIACKMKSLSWRWRLLNTPLHSKLKWRCTWAVFMVDDMLGKHKSASFVDCKWKRLPVFADLGNDIKARVSEIYMRSKS